MKKRLKIFLICVFMTLIVLLPIKSKQINDEMPDAYVNILSEYERVMNDKTYSRDQWKNIYDYVLRFIGKTDLYYCIKDLSGDGKTELILGTKQEIKFEPFIIYSFEESAVYWAGIRENYIMTIYEGGIIEYISGGVWQHFMYERLDGDSAVTDLLAVLVKEEGDGKSPVRYYSVKYTENNQIYEEITKKEFQDIRNLYTGSVERLTWNKLEGFWNRQ